MSVVDRCLTFCLGEEEFAIPLLTVREVIAKPEVTPVPHSPSYFLGVMNLRGLVISLVDLRTKLGIKPRKESEESVIICDFGETNIGVVVDSIETVLTVDASLMSPKPSVSSGTPAYNYITGVYRAEKHLILMLDISKMLNIEDIQNAMKASKKAA